MTRQELNYIKDVFSQIIEDIAGNPDWYEAASAVASDLGTLERELEKKVASLPSNLDEAAIDAAQLDMQDRQIMEATNDERQRYSRIFRRGFKAGAEWMAGQGVEAKVLQAFTDGSAYIECPYEGRSGDKVVVQIRKK